jgi:hypothetical protein
MNKLSEEKVAITPEALEQAKPAKGELSEKDLDKVAGGITVNLTDVQISKLNQSGH